MSAPSVGTLGHGTTLTGSITGAVGYITRFDVAGRKTDSIDVSQAGSPSRRREFVPGMIDEGEYNIEVVYDGSNGGVAQALDSAFSARRTETWTLAYPGMDGTAGQGGSHAGSGFITSLGTPASYDREITQSLTIKFTGVVTFTPAS